MVIGTLVVPETSHSNASFNDHYASNGSKECAIETVGDGARAQGRTSTNGEYFTRRAGARKAIR